jgi:hypothetical protein
VLRTRPFVIGGSLLLGLAMVGTYDTAAAAASSVGAMVRLPAAAVTLPQNAVDEGQVASATQLSGEVALASTAPDALSSFATAVSTPGTPQYHQFLSPGDFAQQFGASSATLSATASWLSSSGLSNVTIDPDHLFVHFSGSAATVQSAFGVNVDRIETSSNTGLAPKGQPLVPATLSSSITGILGLDSLVAPRDAMVKDPNVPQPVQVPAQPAPAVASPHTLHAQTASPSLSLITCLAATALAPDGSLSAQSLANAYGLGSLYAQGRDGAGVSVALAELEPYSPSDIDNYLSCYGINPQVSNVTIDGGPGTGPGQGEAALDIETVAGLAPESHIMVYQGVSAAQATDANMLDILGRIANDDVAKVVSTSWGSCESETDPSLMSSENVIFQQMAAQGQSMFAASGDQGSEACFFSSAAADTSLSVSDPASQPYVTGVGGTSLAPVLGSYNQTTWNNCLGIAFLHCADGAIGGAGGGGVSSVWNKPGWQTGPGVGTGGGREVPDVSASADPYHGDVVAWGGGWEPIAGTSAAAPLWAAATALVDQGCASPTGFLNPTLYAHESQLTDIATGNNDYTQTHGGSYTAQGGYDMATGVGTPKGATLASLLEPGGCPSVSSLSTNGGPTSGGTPVTIGGINLSRASSVHFGSVPAPFTVTGPNSIAATAPAGSPGTVEVSVSTPAGTSAGSQVATFTYTGSVPAPVVTLVDPNGAPVSGRPDVSIYGSGFSRATAVYLGSIPVSFSVQSDTSLTLSAPAAPEPEVVDVTVVGPGGTSARNQSDLFFYDSFVSLDYLHGYTAASADGNVYALGEAPYYGSLYGKHLNQPIVGMVTTPSQAGYWLVASDGGIFAFGNAQFYGSTGAIHLNKPIVGMTATPDGRGYWLVASDGGIFAYGDAQFFGSTGAIHLNQPIVGMSPTPDGRGYWLVASDGGIFAFGNAQFFGSTGAIHLNKPILSMAAMPDGGGYWLMASDGGIFAFGDAPFYGSAAGHAGIWDAIAVAPPGVGYMLLSQSGIGMTFGKGFYVFGSGWGTIAPTAPVVGMSFYATDSVSG